MTNPMPTLERVIAGLGELPPLPEVVTELLEYVRGENVDAQQVIRQIARDQALTARVLRVANSSFYGLQSRVATLQEAVIVLGLRTVATLVTAAGVLNTFAGGAAQRTEQRAFWVHGFGAGLCARALARHSGSDPERAFTAALLHDLGRLALATKHAELFGRVTAYRLERDCHLLQAEREVLGFDHAQVGAALAQRWNFAPEIKVAVEFHHAPEAAAHDLLAVITHVADVMAHALEIPGGESDLMPRLSPDAWQRLKLDSASFKSLLVEVQARRADIETFLV